MTSTKDGIMTGTAGPGTGEPQTLGRRASRFITRFAVESQVAFALIAAIAIFAAALPVFATDSNAQNMSRVWAVLLVVAIGQSFTLLVGGFDISVAANMGLASVVGGQAMLEYGLWTGILSGVLAAAVVGLVNGILVSYLNVSPFIATLGMLTFLTGLTNQISGGQSVFGLPEGLRQVGAADWGPIPSAVGISLIVLGLAWLVLNRTRPGLYFYSIGGGRAASLLAGVPVVRYGILAYTLCGMLAGVAGIMLAARVSVGQANIAPSFELLSIATAVMGGMRIGGGAGRLTGVVLAVALLTVLTTGLDIAGLSQFFQQMFVGAVIVGAVLVEPLRNAGARRLAAFRALTRGRSRAGGLSPSNEH
ncbi:ABC transporter permease [Arthrobacter bambusae]|uniref:Ribose transport system permease protein n=1 Tax=Arthrobacter bambusae TaxID=1338426 RepID=A0AAW8DNK3_9MICC|nr:ABC transporter permease [Arthrobacter bambusae]MDP9907896.1 ribose transport system permease protein [Arthrobacter bambusae]MDQ0132087.1 ribose transport system permease protein [Arthrobacter bambusae]MDQ0183428.1 ribose transport system permease protein [Arthrobacter bambusae]